MSEWKPKRIEEVSSKDKFRVKEEYIKALKSVPWCNSCKILYGWVYNIEMMKGNVQSIQSIDKFDNTIESVENSWYPVTALEFMEDNNG